MEVVELLQWAFVLILLEVVDDRLAVSEDDEVACFQHEADMFHALIDSQQVVIVGAVFLLGWVTILGEECKGLPGVVATLLQHNTQCGSAAICDDCKWCGLRQVVLDECSAWQTRLALFKGPVGMEGGPSDWMTALVSGALSSLSCEAASASWDEGMSWVDAVTDGESAYPSSCRASPTTFLFLSFAEEMLCSSSWAPSLTRGGSVTCSAICQTRDHTVTVSSDTTALPFHSLLQLAGITMVVF
jgi:hypothetical protein